MKQNQKLTRHNTLNNLTNSVQETNLFFLNKAHKQISTSPSPNWVIGHYIVTECLFGIKEQSGTLYKKWVITDPFFIQCMVENYYFFLGPPNV